MPGTGFTSSGLDRLRRVLAENVESGAMPGLVSLVSRRDDVHIEPVGMLAFDGATPMRRNTLFRIASLTKLVTAVAGMMLVEDCKIRLNDTIDRWIPELANRRVLTSIASEIDDTIPAKRAITVRDLFTYRMGFGSVMAMPDTYPIQRYIRECRIGGDGLPHPSLSPATDEWIRALGSLPLIAQPGERWMYNASGDVLGLLVARVSGKSLGEFMRERIFEPLGMKETSFHVAPSDLNRFPPAYMRNYATGALEVFDGVENSTWSPEPPFESGAGGLLSTIDDYFAFSRMLLDKGRHGRTQLLSRATVELMTSDQVPPADRVGAEPFFGAHSSWGLGFAVDIARAEIYHWPGRYGWTGGTGTTAYIDPANELIGILFTQRVMDSPEPPKAFTDFWTAAYAAMT